MKLSLVFLILAAILFAASAIPKISRPWMISIGLGLFACSFMPYFGMRLGN